MKAFHIFGEIVYHVCLYSVQLLRKDLVIVLKEMRKAVRVEKV